MKNKSKFLISGIIIALLLTFVPFLTVYITSGYWTTSNAMAYEGATRILIFGISFIVSLLVFWYTLYVYFKE